MDSLDTYIPPDRRWALARGESLPDRAAGAVLFADVSGFTPLTEALTQSMGARRGAEELTTQLNRVYDAEIAVVEAYGGSVITFSGDAITCWFTSPHIAVGCANALQERMREFSVVQLLDGVTIRLAIKVTVASGVVRRFIVGDPNIRLIDLIAGRTVARTALAEHLAQRSEILLDVETAAQLDIPIIEWREDALTHECFGVLRTPYSHSPPPFSPPPALDQWQLKPWLEPAVYARICAEGDGFLTELRPVVAMFARFQGIDFDDDEQAGEKLNRFVSRVQQILAQYDGALLELTIGDKGSYFYATFGAPHTHEDDARRAVFAARELFPLCRELSFIAPLQIGISQGVMRVGAYGSLTRHTYGAQGDEVNLAARLMSEAQPGMVLVSGRVQKAVANEFDLEPLAPIRLKGKAEPLLPFVVQGLRQTRVQELQEAYYTLPMIGREQEFGLVQEKLAEARRGLGQMIGITAPAGLGKSRLTAEIIRTARRRSEPTYGGECQSFGSNISYLVWASVWRSFFGLDSNLPLRRQMRVLESVLQDLAPKRVDALPLLGTVLHLSIPDNDFTRPLEPELRKSALHALLRDCLQAAGEQARLDGQLLLFVIEDAHWIDPASRELLYDLAPGIAALPVVFLINYRPPEIAAERLHTLENFSNFTQITLKELTDTQGEGLIRAKLAQHAPESTATIPDQLIAHVNAEAQGNPFYIEQLLDYLHDRGINFREPDALKQVQVPNTLHRLILSRLDQLNEQQQLLLKAASIIGRWFSVAHLCGYFPRVGSPAEVSAQLVLLQRYDFATLEHPEPELDYLFKHIVTHQVAYESLLYETRATLHEAYAQYLETHQEIARVLDLLAYHFDRSTNLTKRLEYLKRAGQAAAARFANVEAVDYMGRALALTAENDFGARYELLSAREHVYDVQGERDKQRADLGELEQIAHTLNDAEKQLAVLFKQAWLAERMTNHAVAEEIMLRITNFLADAPLAASTRAEIDTEAALVTGVIAWQQGNAAAAKIHLERALALARTTNLRPIQARTLSFLGTVYRERGEFSLAETHFQEQQMLARDLRDRRHEWAALNNLGLIASTRGDFDTAISSYLKCLDIVREIGDRLGEGLVLSNLAIVRTDQGEYEHSEEYSSQALAIAERIGDRRSICRIMLNLGETYRLLGAFASAQTHAELGLALARELGDQLYEAGALGNLSAIALAQNDLRRAAKLANEALPKLRATGNREGEGFLLNTLGQVQLAQGQAGAARTTLENAFAIWDSLEPSVYALDCYAGLAEIALQHDDMDSARRYVEKILAYLDANPPQRGAPSALNAALTAYRVMVHAHEPRATAHLEATRGALMERAEKITDETRRRTFLENTSVNQFFAREIHTQ